MMLPANHNPFSFRPLLIIITALVTFIPFISCRCDIIIEPGPPQETISPTPQLSITSLTYNPGTNYITCIIANKEKQSTSGKLILQITPGQDTDATIQGATWKDGKYEVELNEAIPVAGSPLTKDFEIQWDTALTNEFTFQAIYIKEKVATPVGSSARVSCNRTILLVLKDLQFDPSTGQITCIIENQDERNMEDIVMHWQAEPSGVQITQPSGVIQETVIGPMHVKELKSLDLGHLDFGKNASAPFTFWLTRKNDTTHYSKQSITFQAPVLPANLQLVAVGPTILETEANKVFRVKITIPEADKGSVYPAYTQLHIQKNPTNSPAKIMYDTKEVVAPLLGSAFKDNHIWGEIALEVDPAGQEKIEFAVQLKYNGHDLGEVKFSWSKDTSSAMFKALKEKNLEALKEFLSKEDNKKLINKIDPDTGHTLLTQAIESLGKDDEGWEFVKVLLGHQADVNLLDGTGLTPLHTAIIHNPDNHTQITNSLLAKFPRLNIATTASGDTPLHLAADSGKEKIMTLLLKTLHTNIGEKPAILNATNKVEKTALQIALEKNHDNIAKQLADAGADTSSLSGDLKNKLTEIRKKK